MFLSAEKIGEIDLTSSLPSMIEATIGIDSGRLMYHPTFAGFHVGERHCPVFGCPWQLARPRRGRCGQPKRSVVPRSAGTTGRGPAVAPTLNQHVENIDLVVDGTREAHPFVGDPDHHLVQAPAIATRGL
jgi:hypothetical protein